MALAVVNYPILPETDLAWIQSVRRAHDPLYFDVIGYDGARVWTIEQFSLPPNDAKAPR